MITIKDVANRAGVSTTSASYALNNTGTISQKTRKRVLKAAKELNYHPNAFARNLKNRKTQTIGVFIAAFSGSFYEEILEGIHAAILQTDYEMIVCPQARTIRRVLTQRQVDAAIVFDAEVEDDTIIKLASEKYPFVVMDRNLKVDYILPLLLDNAQGTREVFQHLLDQGARKIYCVSGVSEALDNKERMKTFQEEAQKHGMSIPCFNGNFSEASGFEAAQKIIGSGDLPDAVFCANDQMAIGFLKAMKEHHLKAPEDIAVVGFDDIQLASYFQPTISTVRASRFQWGSLAAIQLIDFLEHAKPFQLERIPTQLIQRESSSRHP